MDQKDFAVSDADHKNDQEVTGERKDRTVPLEQLSERLGYFGFIEMTVK